MIRRAATTRLDLDTVLLVRDQVRAEAARRSLHQFVQQAWQVLEPGTPFMDNWHIQAICEHLEYVAGGDIMRLVINMPPRMLKSTLVSVCFPVWVWLKHPERRFLTASYARGLAIRDAVASRRIIESAWFRQNFGHQFRLTNDQNEKSRYENDKRGYRIVTSVDSGATGEGGDYRIVDDPIDAKQAFSAAKIAECLAWWTNTMSTRANIPSFDPVVLVMQRVHTQDLAGHFLRTMPDVTHLKLPMRYDPKTVVTTKWFTDPRTKAGQLLMPARTDRARADALALELGSYGFASQLQQEPVPSGGMVFDREKWKYWTTLPNSFDKLVLSVDAAFKAKTSSDEVAIQVWGSKGPDFYLVKRIVGHMGFTLTKNTLLHTVGAYPGYDAILIEDKANGTAIIEELSALLPAVIAIEPEGGKTARAQAIQPVHEAGNIYLPSPEVDRTVTAFVDQCSHFPLGAHDDEVDAMTQAVNWLRQKGRNAGILQLMAEQVNSTRAALAQRAA